MAGFKENGYEVIDCLVDPEENSGLKKYTQLWKMGKRLNVHEIEYVLVGFPGQGVVWLARLLFGRKVVFDMFISIHSAVVHDRKKYNRWGPRALYFWFLDWQSIQFAPVILVHTKTELLYIAKKFFVATNKFLNVYIGAPEPEVLEEVKQRKNFVVHFHGGFTKIQGLVHLVEAAQLVHENVRFQLLGDGLEMQAVVNLIEKHNLQSRFELPGRQPFGEYLSDADVCIGILGVTANTPLMIPNKVFEYMSYGKPIITADTPAMRELFSHEENIYFCEAGNPASIANAINSLVANVKLREKLSEKALELYLKNYTPRKLVRQLLEDLTVHHA